MKTKLIISLIAITFFAFSCISEIDTDNNTDNALTSGKHSRLTQVSSFGTNPGSLAMYKYVPADIPASAATVVVALHGCTQTASAYDEETGWVKFADQWKFALVLAEQNSSNNQNKCFNWFESGDIARGYGEALSIKQMVDKMNTDYTQVDSNSKIYVTGLSAGGYMTTVMLATYPDVFSGGAIFSGGPYKCATTMNDAFTCMSPGVSKTPSQWGDLVRNAYSSYSGAYPIVSIWHGDSDYTVKYANMDETVKQWTNVHGISQTASASDTVKGVPHKMYKDTNGNVKVETYLVPGMGHGTPVDPGAGADQCGTAGAYILDVNICSSYYVGLFWGLDNSDKVAPTTSLTAPSDQASVSGNVTITANASDNVAVTKVEFLVDGKLINTDASSPYSITWNASTAANGSHSIMTRAYDAAGNTGTSDVITVTVTGGVEDTTAPTADLTYPVNGDKVHGSITLSAFASDDYGVTKVEFFVDGVSIGTGSAAGEAGKWTIAWNTTTATAGNHSIMLKAYDAKGNIGTDNDTTVTVDQTILVLNESFSNKDADGDDYDATDWTTGDMTLSSTENHSTVPGGSKSGYLFANSTGSAVTKSTQITLTLSDTPYLTYWRKLDMDATNLYGCYAEFRVYVGATVVDSKILTYGQTYAETSWTEKKNIDLTAFSGSQTIKFEVKAYSGLTLDPSFVKLWIDDIKLGDPDGGEIPGDKDAEIPTVNVSNSGTQSGTIDIAATASDNVGITKVEFYIDGKYVGKDETAPYAVQFDTTTLTTGNHTFMAKAYDEEGNVGVDNDTTLYISNSSCTETSISVDNISGDDGFVYSNGSYSYTDYGYMGYLTIGHGGLSGYDYRAVLSFDTSSIPDAATINRVYLLVDQYSISNDPWSGSNRLLIDINNGCIGTCAIQTTDFNASVTASGAAEILKFSTTTQNSTDFNAAGRNAINKTGKTQIRLRFESLPTYNYYLNIDASSNQKLKVTYCQ